MIIIKMRCSCNRLFIKHIGIRQLSDLSLPSLKCNELYEMAIEKLNLMSETVLPKPNLNSIEDDSNRNINGTKKILECIGITVDDLSKLKVIHVTGAKGKGSTCVLAEQLLKSLGLKTGFYSSPHMFKVNERIRINGSPLPDDVFARYFLQIYWPTMRRRAHEIEADIPDYFNYLTAMAYYIFLVERVDVAIVETGFGGKYDATNLLPHTKTIGITPILFDRTSLFGNTLADLAFNYSEIIKAKSNVFTSRQAPECMEVMENVARKFNAKLQIVPKFDDYKWNTRVNFRIPDSIQKLNAPLAIQLAYNWIRSYKDSIPQHILNKVDFLFASPKNHCPTVVPNEFINPLQTSLWPGRYQILYLGNKTIYFDSGQSCECVKISTEWFQSCTRRNDKPKCLIFSGIAGDDRDSIKSLKIFFDHLDLDNIFFTPNYPYTNNILINNSSIHSRGGYESQLSKCYNLLQIWDNLRNKSWDFVDTKVKVMPCISSCFEQLNKIYKSRQIDIFVTGSLNLVGETLKYLKQNQL